MTGSDLLMLAPWLLFGAGLLAIGFRLFSQRGAARRRRRDPRLPHPPRRPAMRDHGTGPARRTRQPDGRRKAGDR